VGKRAGSASAGMREERSDDRSSLPTAIQTAQKKAAQRRPVLR